MSTTTENLPRARFHWDDPLLLNQQLSTDERMVREAEQAIRGLSSMIVA